MMRKFHFISGLILTTFIGLHLVNHISSIFGAETHIKVMTIMRLFYRNVILESILIAAVVIQVFSGLRLFKQLRKRADFFFEKLHIWSRLYLAAFFLIHVSAVLTGRLVLRLDTNFYFGVAGLNHFPTNIIFIPYYTFAIIAFFGHVAAIHQKKMRITILGLSPMRQAYVILALGIFITFIILMGLTNFFQGVQLPHNYTILIGK